MKDAGAVLVAISPLVPEKSRDLVVSAKLDFNILYDKDNAYAKQLDLVHGFSDELKQIYISFGLDLTAANGNDNWELPIPARIVVDQTKKIRSIKANADYTLRPEPEATLEEVKKLS